MTEEPEVIEAPVTEPAPEIPPETPPIESSPDEGGPKPTQDPLEIARRIELGKRRAAEKRAEDAERRAIQAEERAKVIAEQQDKTTKQQEKIYTLSQVNEFVASGQLKREVADQYIEDVIFPAKAKAIIEAKETELRQRQPVDAATTEIKEYLKYIPELSDPASEHFRRAATEFDDLVRQGFPDDNRTRRAAIKMAHGDLEALRKKAEMQNLSRNPPRLPADAGGGGGGPVNKQDITKAPVHLVTYWDKAKLSQKEREANFKYWQERQATKK